VSATLIKAITREDRRQQDPPSLNREGATLIKLYVRNVLTVWVYTCKHT
jgi:hypothetical protein